MIICLLFTVLGYLLGSIPFSLVIGRLALRGDIRSYGDGNPGAANAWKAGGWHIGVFAMLADFMKGALPVGIFYFLIPHTLWQLILVAVAPVLGHAYSIFLRFKGGKALAVTFGIWAGLTLGEAPIILGLLFAVFVLTFRSNAWAVMLGMVGLLIHFLLRDVIWVVNAIWALNTAVLIWKHRHELVFDLSLRPGAYEWVKRLQ